MFKKANLDLYTDHLLSTFGAATATGLSVMVDAEVRHKQITRFLSKQDYDCKDLCSQVKSTAREIESDDAVLIFDDTAQAKAWTQKMPYIKNNRVCWHFDHCSGHIGLKDTQNLYFYSTKFYKQK